jgi:hypothetical protein
MVQHTHLHNPESLDLASILDMRASAKIDQSAASVYGALLPFHKMIDVVQFVLAVREHLLEIVLGDFQPVEALFLLENLNGLLIQWCPICLLHNASGDN